jgi:YVTN family beta-propeller protein
MYICLANGEGTDVIDTGTDKVIGHIPVGQAPQALIYVENAVSHRKGTTNLVRRVNQDSVNAALWPSAGKGAGFIVLRGPGLYDALNVFLLKLAPPTAYDGFVTGSAAPVAGFKTNDVGMAIGPMRTIASAVGSTTFDARQLFVVPTGSKNGPSSAA